MGDDIRLNFLIKKIKNKKNYIPTFSENVFLISKFHKYLDKKDSDKYIHLKGLTFIILFSSSFLSLITTNILLCFVKSNKLLISSIIGPSILLLNSYDYLKESYLLIKYNSPLLLEKIINDEIN